ncbi:hypothetical protein CHUAL_004318 [Chamberlinius hualienensis]
MNQRHMGPKKNKNFVKEKRKNNFHGDTKTQVKPSTESFRRSRQVDVSKIVEENVLEEPKLHIAVDKPAELNAETSKYAKRQIESNWKKYEVPEEVDETAGTNETNDIFNLLGSKYVGVGTQFRFSHEKEWEDTNFADDSLSEFYALDVTELANSLSCIPLFDRLGIGKEYFTPETIVEMENDATIKLSNYHRIGPSASLKPVIKLAKPVDKEETKTFETVKVKENNVKVEEIYAKDMLPQRTSIPKVKEDLPSESINQLEFELDGLLNLNENASQERLFSCSDDFPVVSFD